MQPSTPPEVGDATPDAPLSKRQYLALRAQLNFAPAPLVNLAVLAFDALLLTACAVLLRRGDWLSFGLAQVLLVVVFFNAFSMLHECGHGSAFKGTALNTLVGHLCSTFCFIPFYPWKYIHQKHHAWTGNIDRDPVLRSLRRWRDTGVPTLVRASWRTWLPLGAIIQHGVFLTYPYQMWRTGELTKGKLIRVAVSVAWMPLSYAVLHGLAPDVVRFGNLALALFLFVIVEEMVNTPHHADVAGFETKLPVWEQHRASRSCYYPRGVSELLVLNFNFHTEHHLFPSLPWFRLRRARTLVKRHLGDHYHEAVGLRWNVEHRRSSIQIIVNRYSLKPHAVAAAARHDSAVGEGRNTTLADTR
jgi:omega-6 fatty acid desaturase (delta-12 desaturase)